jgi:hypothetical protein
MDIMDCIIKERRIKVPRVSEHDRRIARLEGKKPPRAQRPVQYENLETGEAYLCISGGLAWPALRPGASVVLGVQKEGESFIYKVLEAIEEPNVQVLLERSHDLFLKWGANCKTIPWMWYGNPEDGMNDFLLRFNVEMQNQDSKAKYICITYSPYHDDPKCFTLHCHRILSMLQPGAKRVYLGSSRCLQSCLGELTPDVVSKGQVSDYPIVGALGYVLTALDSYSPWLRDVGRYNGHEGSLETFATIEAEMTRRHLGINDFGWGENEEYDDGALVPTVRP